MHTSHAFTIKLVYREGDMSAEHSPILISPEPRSPTCPGSPNATLSPTRPSSGPLVVDFTLQGGCLLITFKISYTLGSSFGESRAGTRYVLHLVNQRTLP